MNDRRRVVSEAGEVTITRDDYGVPHVRGKAPISAQAVRGDLPLDRVGGCRSRAVRVLPAPSEGDAHR
jgi:hypothetical protein